MEDLERNYQVVKSKQETSVMTSKTLEHILARMKKDEITYQIKINFYEKKVKELDSAINETESKKLQLTSFQALSSIAAKEVKESYLECNQRRTKDMEEYESLVRKKKEADMKE